MGKMEFIWKVGIRGDNVMKSFRIDRQGWIQYVHVCKCVFWMQMCMYDCVFDVSSMVVNEQRYGKEKI